MLVSAQFWVQVGLLAIIILPLTLPVKWPPQFWVKEAFNYLLWAATFYLNANLIVPKTIFKGRVLIFILIVLAAQVIFVQLSHYADRLLRLDELMAQLKHGKKEPGPDINDFLLVIITLIIFGISTVTVMVQRLQADQLRAQLLERERMTTELSFLKAQINPHFFFNVLNTIYALIDTDKGTAKDSVYTLSHMMRYVLYDTQHELARLEKEVAFLEDYVKLMQLRLTSQTQVIFEKTRQLTDARIAPMLFLPYIENAFKHGTSTIHPGYIFIKIQQQENMVTLEVRNSLFTEVAGHMEASNGIGLLNTRRRLELLYPGRHELTVERDTRVQEYILKLKIVLP